MDKISTLTWTTMNKKTITRIAYGLIAVVLLVLAGREIATLGMTAEGVAAGGIGVLLAFMAITGAG
jgi:hypothetical protein